jgi:hypothetical protein
MTTRTTAVTRILVGMYIRFRHQDVPEFADNTITEERQ